MDYVFADRDQLNEARGRALAIAAAAIEMGEEEIRFWLLESDQGLVLVNRFDPRSILAWERASQL